MPFYIISMLTQDGSTKLYCASIPLIWMRFQAGKPPLFVFQIDTSCSGGEAFWRLDSSENIRQQAETLTSLLLRLTGISLYSSRYRFPLWLHDTSSLNNRRIQYEACKESYCYLPRQQDAQSKLLHSLKQITQSWRTKQRRIFVSGKERERRRSSATPSEQRHSQR
jgi:hypothetical protein